MVISANFYGEREREREREEREREREEREREREITDKIIKDKLKPTFTLTKNTRLLIFISTSGEFNFT